MTRIKKIRPHTYIDVVTECERISIDCSGNDGCSFLIYKLGTFCTVDSDCITVLPTWLHSEKTRRGSHLEWSFAHTWSHHITPWLFGKSFSLSYEHLPNTNTLPYQHYEITFFTVTPYVIRKGFKHWDAVTLPRTDVSFPKF